ncbi:hypothetical protein Fcan01_12292 [Folsomia candida]|uniref:Ig-like domain-containing protein n=1 Tax=Folsomia candida TaxID=158441 RepID=A0A226E561_FOLCA|nr:hypothetical protein Fcan01_12292 [Folsomia candida]
MSPSSPSCSSRVFTLIGLLNVQSIQTDTVVTEAGSNLTLACPGATEHSLVSVLEWYCHGCSSAGVLQQPSSSHPGDVKLVELRRDSTTVWQNRERVTLNSETYALNFHPVVAGDTGEYKCLVNDRRLPESILKLVVQAQQQQQLLLQHCLPSPASFPPPPQNSLCMNKPE